MDKRKWFQEINIFISEWLSINFHKRIEKKAEPETLLLANDNLLFPKILYGSKLHEITVNFVHTS